MTWNEWHTESEKLAAEAQLHRTSGDLRRAEELYRRAAEAESKAVEEVLPGKDRTLGITAVSAIALWYKGGDYATAEALARRYLADGGLPDFAQQQIQDLFQMIRSARTVEAAEPDPWRMSDPSEILLKKLADVERIIATIGRRNGMDPDETEEFTAEVKLRLVRDDYAIIRKFQGRSKFETYIAAVVKRLLLDYRNHQWGKWHDAAQAERLGPLAIDLARLVQRDGYTLDEALKLLESKYPGVTREQLESLEASLPPKYRRKKVDLEEVDSMAAPAAASDPVRDDTARRISETVNAFVADLPDEDQLIIRMRFEMGMTVAQISRSLALHQQQLYRRLYNHFDALRAELTRVGVAAEDVEELIGTDTDLLQFRFKNGRVRPSKKDESAVAARQEDSSS